VRHHPEAPGLPLLGHAAAEPMSGQHQVDNEDPLLNESELDDGEASVLPASRSSQAAPTVTTGGVVGTLLQQMHWITNILIFCITRRNTYASLLHCIILGVIHMHHWA
jgi:hypothetical protein